MSWLGLLLRNLTRRPGRSIFTLLGVALAVGSFLALASLSSGMRDGSKASLEERGIDLVVVKRGMVEVFGGSLPEVMGERIRSIPGVAAVAAELDTMLQLDDDAHVVVSGWGQQDFAFREMKLLRGRLPQLGEAAVILGDGLAEARQLDLGSRITLDFTSFEVVGIGAFSSAMLRGLVVMPLVQMQALLARSGTVTLFQVRLAAAPDTSMRESVRGQIGALSRDLLVTTTDEALRSSKIIAMLSASSLAIGAVALTMACLSVLNTLAMAVEERTREIGILAAIGWRPPRILALILSEGLLLAAVGGALGIALGLIGNQLLTALVLPGSGLTASASAELAAVGLATALLVGTVGALWPAWRASRMPPVVAIRHQ